MMESERKWKEDGAVRNDRAGENRLVIVFVHIRDRGGEVFTTDDKMLYGHTDLMSLVATGWLDSSAPLQERC